MWILIIQSVYVGHNHKGIRLRHGRHYRRKRVILAYLELKLIYRNRVILIDYRNYTKLNKLSHGILDIPSPVLKKNILREQKLCNRNTVLRKLLIIHIH